MSFKDLDGRTKLRYVEMEVDTYMNTLSRLEKENNQETVSTRFVRHMLRDIKRVMGKEVK